MMKMNSDNQVHMIVFAVAAAVALALVSSVRGLALIGSLGILRNALPFYMRYDNTGLNIYRFISELGTYLRGAGLFLLARSVTISRKKLPYSAAMIVGIALFIIPSAITNLLRMIYQLYSY